MSRSKIPITVIMLTLNEEYHIREAIENVQPWAFEIFILDSCSTDNTVNTAMEYGVKIAQRRFTNFGDQWNFAIENLPITTPWTMKLDPDERVTPELVEEMRLVIQSPGHCDGYWMSRRLWFMGKPLHVKNDVLRLWKSGKCRFSDVLVNEHPLIDGRVGRLRSLIEHYDSSDLNHWMEKQNRYSTMEAIMKVKASALTAAPKLFGSKLERRMFLKKYFNFVPLRFFLYWLYLALTSGVLRDGAIGLAWIHLRTEVMRMRTYKTIEMIKTGRIPETPRAAHGDFDPRVMATPLQKQIMLSPNW